MACGAAWGRALMRCSPLIEPAVERLCAILRLLRAFDLVALAMRGDEVVCGVLATIGQRDNVIEREVVQRDRRVTERAMPATFGVT